MIGVFSFQQSYFLNSVRTGDIRDSFVGRLYGVNNDGAGDRTGDFNIFKAVPCQYVEPM